MTHIYSRLTDQVLSAIVVPALACSNRKTVQLNVAFDSAWDGLAKSAVFYTSTNPTVYEVPITSGKHCIVPEEVLVESGRLFIGIKGINASTGEIKASTLLNLKIMPGTPLQVVSDPTGSIYEKLLSAYGLAADEIAVERARISNLIAGGTVGDAEMIDLRVDEEGTTHKTAGDAARATAQRKANKTDINRFLRNDVFGALDVAHEIGDVVCDYKGGTWVNFVSESFTLAAGTHTLIIPKLDIPAVGNICLEYEGGVTDAKLRIVSATKAGAYQFYHAADKVGLSIVFRVRISGETEPAKREYRAFSPIVVRGDTSQTSIIPEYLTNCNHLLSNKVSVVRGKNLFDKNSVGNTYGVYLNSNNVITPHENLMVTDFMPVLPNTEYVASGYKIQAAYVNFYNEDRQYISGIQGYDITGNCVTTPEDCYFIKWSVAISAVDAFQLEKGNVSTGYEPYTDHQPTVILEKKVAALENKNANTFMATCDTLNGGDTLTVIDRADVKKNKTYVFSAQVGSSVNIRLGHGSTEYGASYLDITDTTVTAYNVTASASKAFEAAHGLNIGGFITVVVKVGITASVSIFTASGIYNSPEFEFSGCNGAVYAKNNGNALSDCSCSVTFCDIDSPAWIFGDSYLGLTNEARYPKYLLEMGFDDWLACGFPGGGSAQELASFETLLQLGKPKYVVWCLGMNNGDGAAINQAWLAATETLISLCKNNGITVILATIPNCTIDNSYKNAWIKASGHRYVDFEKAVCVSDGWRDGMLSGDGIHPTALGAKALASRLIADFPEITAGKS